MTVQHYLCLAVLSSSLCSSLALLDSEPHRLARIFEHEERILAVLEEFPGRDRVQLYRESCSHRILEVPLGSPTPEVLQRLVGNPVHVYCLVHRLLHQLPPLLKELQEEQELLLSFCLPGQEQDKGPLVSQLGQLVKDLGLVDLVDSWHLELAAVGKALARIQYAYRLDPIDLAWGYIRGIQTQARLSLDQMLDIGSGRYSGLHPLRTGLGREFALAVEWAEAALARVRREGQPAAYGLGLEIEPTGQEQHILNTVIQYSLDHDTHWISPVGQKGILPNEEKFLARLRDTKGEGPDGRLGRTVRRAEAAFLAKEPDLPLANLTAGYSHHDFYSLCRGDPVTRVVARLDPHCYLRHRAPRGNQHFMLPPLREEVVSSSPLLLLYHDMLTEQEMQLMVEKVSTQMGVATVQDLTTQSGKVSIERSQSSGWLWDQDHPLLYKLGQKTSVLTGLEVARPKGLLGTHGGEWVEAEAWQMGLYGPGGHYLPHFDAFDVLDDHAWSSNTQLKIWRGNRMATVMYYLSDLVGGATAFPNLGVAATPRRGTAVFWYNMEEDGVRIPESLHGACPTALGIKWVSNKWIREGSQLWKRPCSLKPNI